MNQVPLFVIFLTVLASSCKLANGQEAPMQDGHLHEGSWFGEGEMFRELGVPCDTNTTCTDIVPNSFCNKFSMCSCPENFIPGGNGKKCLERHTARIGDPCEAVEQCMGVDSSTSYYWHSESTVCLGDSVCDCRRGYIHNNDHTNCLKIAEKLGEPCSDDVQCQFGPLGELSSCIGSAGTGNSTYSTCKCSPNAVPNEFEEKCIKRATVVGEPCESQAQCTANLKFTRCVNNVCKCNPGYAPNSAPGTACVKA